MHKGDAGVGRLKVAKALRSRSLGTELALKAFPLISVQLPSSQQMFIAANSIHQGWVHRDGQGKPMPLKNSKSRGGVRYESRWIPESRSAMETGEGVKVAIY